MCEQAEKCVKIGSHLNEHVRSLDIQTKQIMRVPYVGSLCRFLICVSFDHFPSPH